MIDSTPRIPHHPIQRERLIQRCLPVGILGLSLRGDWSHACVCVCVSGKKKMFKIPVSRFDGGSVGLV